MSCATPSWRRCASPDGSGAGHALDVQGLVQLLLGDPARGYVPAPTAITRRAARTASTSSATDAGFREELSDMPGGKN